MERTFPGTTTAGQQARFAAGLAGCLPPFAGYGHLKDHGALLSAAAAVNDGCPYDCAAAVASAAQSDLTCNGGVPSRKRGREDELEWHNVPIPGMHQPVAATAVASRMAESATASTSGRPDSAVAASSVADALVAEMCRQGAEIDALVQAERGRLLAGLEQARRRQRLALALARAAAAAALSDREVELEAARRRAAELEERLRQAAAENQAWRGAARSSEVAAAGLRAALASLLLGGGGGPAAQPAEEEGFGDSGSCCFKAAATAASSGSSKRACRACGGGEASVLLLPCRHLCLCRACEPRADACPVCLAARSASIHVAAD